jgi:hypothetical protein
LTAEAAAEAADSEDWVERPLPAAESAPPPLALISFSLYLSLPGAGVPAVAVGRFDALLRGAAGLGRVGRGAWLGADVGVDAFDSEAAAPAPKDGLGTVEPLAKESRILFPRSVLTGAVAGLPPWEGEGEGEADPTSTRPLVLLLLLLPTLKLAALALLLAALLFMLNLSSKSLMLLPPPPVPVLGPIAAGTVGGAAPTLALLRPLITPGAIMGLAATGLTASDSPCARKVSVAAMGLLVDFAERAVAPSF